MLLAPLLGAHYSGTPCGQRFTRIAGISTSRVCLLITEKQHALIRNYLLAVSV